MIEKKINKQSNKCIRIFFLTTLILINCNFESYCYDDIGSERPDGCYIILAIYNNSSEESKMRTNLSGILAVCQYQIDQINKCKKEPKYWPIPNEVAD